MNKLTQFLVDGILNDPKPMLNEGGAYGHLAHPYEDMELTFQDLRKMVDQALIGNLKAFEKTDGQQLSFTWKDGQLRLARNKGHLKNQGQNALTKDSIKVMFSDKPQNIQDAFGFAVEDLSNALSKVSQEELNQMFGNGKKFASVEVIYPATKNVIPYNLSMLVFHGIIEYNDLGEPIAGGDAESGVILGNLIKSVNSDVQNTFTIRGPNQLLLSKVSNLPLKQKQFMSMIDQLQGSFSDQTQIIEYHKNWWNNFIREKSDSFGYAISPEVSNLLVKRWAEFDKSVSIKNILKQINNEEFKNFVNTFDKESHEQQYKNNIRPFEEIFLKLGVEVLKNAAGYMASSPNDAAKQIANDVLIQAKSLKSKGATPDQLNKLKNELQRLKVIGGLNKIVGSEGLTFYYNDKIYKLTGLFAPVNQILGLLKYQR